MTQRAVGLGYTKEGEIELNQVATQSENETLSLAELQEVKIPQELFEVFSITECRKYGFLPIRFDSMANSVSIVICDLVVSQDLEEYLRQLNIQIISPYLVSNETFELLLQSLELEIDDQDLEVVDEKSQPGSWTIALIEPDSEQKKALVQILESQRYGVICFKDENEFKTELQKIATRVQDDEDLVNLAESKQILPFHAVLVREDALSTPKTFCDFVWAHFNHLHISVLEDRWMGQLIEQGRLESAQNVDDFAFHLRHGNYYHAAIESLKKEKIFQAVELLEQVTEEDAHYIKAKMLLGKAFLKKKNYNKALHQFQKAYDFWCEDPDGIVDDSILKLLFHLAYTFEKLGRLDDALKLYERVAAENPLFREVSQRLARVKNKRQKAIKASEQKLGLPAFSKSEREEHRYEKLEEIGKGGMGIVYRARDQVLGREVALKILNSHFKHDEKIVETFLREAKSLASLNHLNIVTIFDAGIEDGNYYISMEFIDGRTVRELLKKKGHFRLSTSLALCKQVLKALAYAHSKHVIHRDITTNNMMLTETKVVKLMDFGLARVVNQLHSEQSIIGGTPYFMSPEQVEGAPIDHRTDIYSFGVCLFEMLTGQVPFPMENPGYHHLHTEPPTPKKLRPDMPQEINDLILKCLRKKPEQRFQSADEILEIFRSLPTDGSAPKRVKMDE